MPKPIQPEAEAVNSPADRANAECEPAHRCWWGSTEASAVPSAIPMRASGSKRAELFIKGVSQYESVSCVRPVSTNLLNLWSLSEVRQLVLPREWFHNRLRTIQRQATWTNARYRSSRPPRGTATVARVASARRTSATEAAARQIPRGRPERSPSTMSFVPFPLRVGPTAAPPFCRGKGAVEEALVPLEESPLIQLAQEGAPEPAPMVPGFPFG